MTKSDLDIGSLYQFNSVVGIFLGTEETGYHSNFITHNFLISGKIVRYNAAEFFSVYINIKKLS